eukprot:gene7153-7964_t
MTHSDPTVSSNMIVKGRFINNGKALGFNVAHAETPIKLAGTVFRKDTYTLRQFHFHFGCEGEMGSEHSLNGQRFPGEIHFIFTNDKYQSGKEAMKKPDGLAALAFFIQYDDKVENRAMARLNENLQKLRSPHDSLEFPDGLSLTNLVPALKQGIGHLSRFAYKGSLPTPPCYESVTWIVFRRPVKMKPATMENMRNELQSEKARMCNNFRPTQPLNDRRVFKFLAAQIQPTIKPSARPSGSSVQPATLSPALEEEDAEIPDSKSIPLTKLVGAGNKAAKVAADKVTAPETRHDMQDQQAGHSVGVGEVQPANVETSKQVSGVQQQFTAGSPATSTFAKNSASKDSKLIPEGNTKQELSQQFDNKAQNYAAKPNSPAGQVSVSSSAASSMKFNKGAPQAYISSLSSGKADPKIPVNISGGGINDDKHISSTSHPQTSSQPPTRHQSTRLPTTRLPTTKRPTTKQIVTKRPTIPFPTQPPNTKTTWNYKETDTAYGPLRWSYLAPQCAGKHQSPINIVTADAERKPISSPLLLDVMDDKSDPTKAANLMVRGRFINNGRAIGFKVMNNDTSVKLSGDVVGRNMYTLRQCHFHIGCEGEMGSEHSLDGVRYPGEIHFMFSNDKYKTRKQAEKKRDGLAAIAILLRDDPTEDNHATAQLQLILRHIARPNTSVEEPKGFPLRSLMPLLKKGMLSEERFVYRGSLTAPPCTETVTWIVFKNVVDIQRSTFETMQKYIQGTHGQVSVSSSAASSMKFNKGAPQAYISSLSSGKADPKISVNISGGGISDDQHISSTSHPQTSSQPPTRHQSTRLPTTRLPTTRLPTTRLPTTRRPTTGLPTTRRPTTRGPTTQPPTPPKKKITWNYKETDQAYGPLKWSYLAPQCAGKYQSPINIVTADAEKKSISSPLLFDIMDDKSDPSKAANLMVRGKFINNGRALGFKVMNNDTSVKLSGDVVGRNMYTLRQYHFHFGCEGEMGSEHSLDGVRYPGEIHFLFSNDKYKTRKQAEKKRDGFAAIAVFLRDDPTEENPGTAQFQSILRHIARPNTSVDEFEGFSLRSLMPFLKEGMLSAERFAYRGSLTAPPCTETVTWIVFKNVIDVQRSTFEMMQKYTQGTHGKMCNNYRPVKPVNDRRVFGFLQSPSPGEEKTTVKPNNKPTKKAKGIPPGQLKKQTPQLNEVAVPDSKSISLTN